VRDSALIVLLLAAGCDSAPQATEPFSDAAIAALGAFDDDDPATLVRAFEQLEGETFDQVAPDAADFTKRALTPHDLAAADVEGLTRPDRDPALTLPVALAWLSPHPVAEHDRIVMVADQVGIEPFADSYSRTFVDGHDCYPDTCAFLRTSNDMVKDNPEMTVPFTLKKDWRAFVLSDGRPARASRGWMEEGADSTTNADRIEQSFAIELWIEQEDGTTLRLLVLWAETTFESPQDETLVAWTTELGMNELFQNHDGWIVDNG